MIAGCFPGLSLGSNLLQFVEEFKYLDHTVKETITDDADIQLGICRLV